jgi:hypothetical protein
MARASFASMHLARFEALRASEAPKCEDWPGVLSCQDAADSRAAGVDPASREAFVLVVLGPHTDTASAERLMDDRQSAAPWMASPEGFEAAVEAGHRALDEIARGNLEDCARKLLHRHADPITAARPGDSVIRA